MAIPGVRGVGTIGAGAAVAITPTAPSGHATNDREYLFVETGGDTPTLSTPNGFSTTPLFNVVDTATSTRFVCFTRTWNGTDGDPTVAATANHAIGRILGLIPSGANPITEEAITTGVDDTSSTSASVPGGTTTGADRLAVVGLTTDLPDATSTTNFSGWTNANLASITDRINNTRAAGNGGGLNVITGQKATSGSIGSTSITLANAAVKAMASFAAYDSSGATGANYDVPAQVVTAATFVPTVLGGANYDTPAQALGASVTPVTVVLGADHILTPLVLSGASVAVTVEAGANVDVAAQLLTSTVPEVVVSAGGDVAVLVDPQIVTLAQTIADVAAGANVDLSPQVATFGTVAPDVIGGAEHVVAVQTIGSVVVPPAIVGGAVMEIPVQLVTLSVAPVLTDTSSVLVNIGPLVLELAANNGKPISMYLTRIHPNGMIERERYRFPLG